MLYETRQGFENLPQKWPELIPTADVHVWLGILMGGFIAFYAYIGFEDMVNIAEEVQEPSKNMPTGIIIALCVTTVLYFFVALAAMLSMDTQELVKSDAPLATLLSSQGVASTYSIALIGLVAIVNGAFVQMLMASRVIYGMSMQGMGPTCFAKVNSKTNTPVFATVLVTLLTIVLVLSFGLVTLAKITSFIILFVFLVVNLSLLRIKKYNKGSANTVSYPKLIPLIGALLCTLLMTVQIFYLVKGI